jgi:hypothetical protein
MSTVGGSMTKIDRQWFLVGTVCSDSAVVTRYGGK